MKLSIVVVISRVLAYVAQVIFAEIPVVTWMIGAITRAFIANSASSD